MASESGCPIEFHRIDVDKCDPVFDEECQGNKYIPFLRADYDRRTGRSPNSPREQVIRAFLELAYYVRFSRHAIGFYNLDARAVRTRSLKRVVLPRTYAYFRENRAT